MKKLFTLSILVALFTLVSINVNAQTQPGAVSASAGTEATIISPIQIAKTVDMNFGNIVSGVGTGTVVLSTSDTRSKTGDITLPTATPGTIKSAQFTVTGLSAATYAITLPTSLSLTGSVTGNMLVNNFVSTPSATGLLTGGTETVKVGATLNVGAAQAAGTYSGNFSVTVAYN